MNATTDRAILAWNAGQFNIQQGDTFNFQVPANGSILNKVGYTSTGALGTSDTATINGSLQSNGRVFILANGNIQIGGGAQISTQGLFLSTLAESDNFNFLALGNLALTGSSTGSITIGGVNSAQTTSNTSQVNVVGSLGAWAGSITPNNVSVTGDMIINQRSSSTLTLTGANGPTNVNGNLTVATSAGAITQTTGSNLTVGNLTSINTNGNATVNLTNAGNNFNTVTANSGALAITDVNSIILGNSTVATSLTVTAANDISTSGAVAVNGNATLTSTGVGNITFANNSSVTGTFNATTTNGNITVNVAGNLTTGTISAPTGGGLTLGAVSVTNGGTGYTGAPTVTLIGGGGTGATATAVYDSATGTITAVNITNVGAGYTSAPSIVLTGGGANPTSVATATAQLSTGIGSITIPPSSGGAGYGSAPTVVISGGGGTGATADAVVSSGVVTGFTITNAGTGYTSLPTITLTGGSPVTPANTTAASVALAPAALTGIVAGVGGTGYTGLPTITFINAGGTGAVASAAIASGQVTSLSLVSGGTGFTSAPAITFIGGGTNPIAAASVGSLALTAASTVNVTAAGNLTVAGPISASSATLSAASIASSNATATPSVTTSGPAVLTATAGNIVLPTISASRVSVTAGNGSISQFANGTVSSTITTTAGGTVNDFTASPSGNITLTNNNSFANNAWLSLVGRDALIANTRNITISNANLTGNLSVNTTQSSFGAGAVTIGAGGGSAGTAVNVGGNLTIATNNSDVADDTAADVQVQGAVNVTTGTIGQGAVYTIAIASGSTGFTSAPSVTISGGGGAAVATAVINTNGVVTAINITNMGGTAYTSIPTITFAGGGGTGLSATVGQIGPAGNVSFTAGSAGVGGSARYGQFNIVARDVNIQENTSVNLGAITANSVTANSTAGDVLITGSVTTHQALSVRASSGNITEVGSGVVNVGTTSSWNASNTANFGTNLSNSANSFGGTVTVINGNNDIIVSGSNITVTPGNVTSGSLTVNTVNAGTVATLSGGNATDVRVNAAGRVVLNNALVRNLTINSTDTAANAVATSGNLTANGTVTITSSGGVLLNNTTNNITGNVVLSNVAGNATVYSARNLTISGNVAGTLTAIAGTANSTSSPGNTFANPWNLVLGNLNVGSLNAAAMNGVTVPFSPAGSITSGGSTQAQVIVAVNVLNGGTGYAVAPTVTLSNGATGTATIANGVVTGITITNVGTGFTGTPTITLGSGGETTSATVALATSPFVGAFTFVPTEGNSGNITQASGSRLHVENTANFATFSGNIVLGNNGNNAGRVQLSTGGGTGIAGSGDITYSEDPTAKIGVIATTTNATITSRFGSIVEDSTGAVIRVGGVLSLNAPNGSVMLGNATGLTQGTIASTNVTATGAVALSTSGNLTLASMAANTLTVTANSISQSGPLNIFGLSTFTANNGISLTDAGNNFGPLSLTTINPNTAITVTEANTMNLRTVSMPGGGNGTFTANSVNGDIIDTGFGGVRLGGALVGSPAVPQFGSGIVSLTANNGNIIINDSTSDILTTAGVAFNARNVTLSVMGSTGSSLILGANSVTSNVSGNLTAMSALGNIGNGGAIRVGGTAMFQTGTGNITIDQPNVGFGALLFIGNQVRISESGTMDILTGSSAIGPAQLVSGGDINIVDSPSFGASVTFGNSVTMQAANITLQKTQVAGFLTLNHTGTANLSALSKSADLSGRDPIDNGPGPGPGPGPNTNIDPSLQPKP